MIDSNIIPIEDDLLACIYNGDTEERDIVLESARPDWFITNSGRVLYSLATAELENGRLPSWSSVLSNADPELRSRVATLSGKMSLSKISIRSVVKSASERCQRVQIASACEQAEQELGSGETPLDVAVRLETKLRDLSSDGTEEIQTIGSAAQKLLEDSERASKRKAMFSGISSGIHGLDNLTGGWRGGQMVVIAARTGEGKTSLATQLLLHASRYKWDDAREDWASKGFPVCLVELEMTAQEVAQRAVAHLGGPPLWKLRDAGKLTDKDLADGKQALSTLHNLPFFVDAPPRMKLGALRAKARSWKRRHGMEVLCVDLIGKVGGESKERDRWREVATVSHGLKALAKELNCVVFAIAQLNRDAAGGDDAGVHQIRESGDIEQDADVVMLLTTNPKDPTVKTLRIAKNRSGLTGRIAMRFNGDTQTFKEIIPEAK
jgi:replicative DNA helicase